MRGPAPIANVLKVFAAGVAELVDAQGLGPCFLWKVGVQVPSPAPTLSSLFWEKWQEQ